MANKCLRRFLRSAGRRQFLFFSTHNSHSHPGTSCTADRKLLKQLDHNMQVAQTHLYSISCANRFACLPCCRPPVAASSYSSACLSADEEEESLYDGHGDVENTQLLRRSHSCSKLQPQCSHKLPFSFRPLFHRTRSQSHHSQYSRGFIEKHYGADDSEAADEQFNSTRSAAASPTAACGLYSEYTRSRSSPNLRISCHKKKAAGCSFHGELDLMQQGRGNSSKGKPRTPKGHVAVYVDGGRERHVVPIPYLSHPDFQDLLGRAESEFGFAQKGGLLLPCTLAELHQTLYRIQSQPN